MTKYGTKPVFIFHKIMMNFTYIYAFKENFNSNFMSVKTLVSCSQLIHLSSFYFKSSPIYITPPHSGSGNKILYVPFHFNVNLCENRKQA